MRAILKLLISLLIEVVSKKPEKKRKKKIKQNDFFKKWNVKQVESGIPSIDFAFSNNIDKSLVTRWIQNKKEIIDGVSRKTEI